MAVPKVGWGGFVTPWVPVAITPGGKAVSAAATRRMDAAMSKAVADKERMF